MIINNYILIPNEIKITEINKLIKLPYLLYYIVLFKGTKSVVPV